MPSRTVAFLVAALSACQAASPCPKGASSSRLPDPDVDGGVAVVCRTPDGRLDGPVALTWDGKRERLTGAFDQGRPVGRWTWWYPDGRKRASYGFTAGEPSGRWETWYPNGKAQWTVAFVEGAPSGPLREGRADGTTRFEGAFTAGRRSGTWTAWRGSAKVGEGQYEDDRPSGRWIVWWKNGAVAARRDGQRDWTYAGPDGGVLSRREYDSLRRPPEPPADPLNPLGTLALVELAATDPFGAPDSVPPLTVPRPERKNPLYPWQELDGVWFDEFRIELGLDREDLDQASP